MQTLNISLTKEQYTVINELVDKWGFANRSEFFRALIRALIQPSELSQPLKFQRPPIKNPKKIMQAFKDSRVYNKKFLTSLEKGLSRSTHISSKQSK
ncbi:MAG: hypothetical protein A2445_04665 [Candidatus Jacksonbacteria bacterium RIFOXYC2_FULL_44_29]|nr:MAG: hypothetical protein A2240_03495 [Candidatus Jacksonbacteria bacterium RIFOXYA2_FULL_43_12]OGY76705.1 MAG: hypothetical protein A2295_06050 [Candidatus Jacksonbacteria bacterium RIFOXYB2_FULL_44_15]OGY78033.1 MAG: hypothetical protein A2445_04665 [Candidatus Jacksonbacteria bacterium RIFOXYC2_FULL_44_29]OGY81867.1 MAG: hypothetical protein A2550_03085 [Candidatus Jacksonbacteria bacterium RIFOXYD2_FULL_43_21]HBH46247.1 hypothetical protein [Candidatus Jacksonbacteria bacterium]